MSQSRDSDLVEQLRILPNDDINLIHIVLTRIEDDGGEENDASIKNAFDEALQENNMIFSEHEAALEFMLGLHMFDLKGSLYEKFKKLLQEAEIALTEGDIDSISNISSPDPEFLEHMVARAVIMDRRILIRESLNQWREATEDRRVERMWQIAVDHYDRRLRYKCLSHWYNTYDQVIRPLDYQAMKFYRRENDKMIAESMRKWSLEYRSRSFTRQAQDRLALKALGVMMGKLQDVQIKDSAIVYEPNLAKKSLKQWSDHVSTIRRNERWAEDAHDYFSMMTAISKWRYKMELNHQDKRRLEKLEQIRLRLMKIKYFRKWQGGVRAIKQAKYGVAYKKIRTTNKENIAKAAIRLWKNATEEVHQMDAGADSFYQLKKEERGEKMAHNAITTMYGTAMKTKEDENIADQLDRRNLIRRVGVISKWEDDIQKVQDGTSRADELMAIKNAQLSSSAFKKLKAKGFEISRRIEDADAFYARQQRRALSSYLDKWRRASAQKQGTVGELPPITPAVRKTQLLASTTPSYTPFVDRLRNAIDNSNLNIDEDDGDNDNEFTQFPDTMLRS